MGIDVPRLNPVQTPVGATEEDAIRVQRVPREQRIPSELGHPVVDRRVLLDRRHRRDRRPAPMDMRSGHERRAGEGVDVDA